MSPVNTDLSVIENRAPNVAVQFRDRVAASPRSEAYRFPAGDGEDWSSMTWKETGDRVERLAAGLLSLGLESEQRVGIAAATRVEWILADLAVMCAGGATTTVYPSTMAEDVAYIVSDSECRVVFAEDAGQVQKLRQHRTELPHLDKVVVIDDEGGVADGDWVITMAELEERGAAHLAEHPDAVTQAVEKIQSDQLATLIYTSGTTGKPKGVRLRHSAWTFEGAAIQAQGILDESDLQFLWLPMAHSFGKVLLSSQLACGFATA
ncbi:MAG: AMP-dependent synthetase, partial [Marmoricola sp.]|nr:AMP-dependent synthetase [Marmoricola sp.]